MAGCMVSSSEDIGTIRKVTCHGQDSTDVVTAQHELTARNLQVILQQEAHA